MLAQYPNRYTRTELRVFRLGRAMLDIAEMYRLVPDRADWNPARRAQYEAMRAERARLVNRIRPICCPYTGGKPRA